MSDAERRRLREFEPQTCSAAGGGERRRRHGVELVSSESHTYPVVLPASVPLAPDVAAITGTRTATCSPTM
jgi:hypothetical protein